MMNNTISHFHINLKWVFSHARLETAFGPIFRIICEPNLLYLSSACCH